MTIFGISGVNLKQIGFEKSNKKFRLGRIGPKALLFVLNRDLINSAQLRPQVNANKCVCVYVVGFFAVWLSLTIVQSLWVLWGFSRFFFNFDRFVATRDIIAIYIIIITHGCMYKSFCVCISILSQTTYTHRYVNVKCSISMCKVTSEKKRKNEKEREKER